MTPTDHLLCQYPSKRCDNVRSLKISGDLHRFCLFHRCRANDAQRRWTKRKMQATDADVQQPTNPKTSRRKTTTKRNAALYVQAIAPLPTGPTDTLSDELFELIDKSLEDVALPQEIAPLPRVMDPCTSFSALLQHHEFIV